MEAMLHKHTRWGAGGVVAPQTLKKYSKISPILAKFCPLLGKNVGKQWALCRSAPLDFFFSYAYAMLLDISSQLNNKFLSIDPLISLTSDLSVGLLFG